MTPDEKLLRQAHSSLAITWGTDAPHAFGSIRLERVGFADIPYLVVPVWVKESDLSSIIPPARQRAFGYLAERGVSDEHLTFKPNVSIGRRQLFFDQGGKRRFGEACEVRFELSAALAAAVDWSSRLNGKLVPAWELGTRIG